MFSGQAKPSGSNCWGEVSRSLATLVLVVYLTGLGLSVACNSGSGSSLLLGVVKERLFSFWNVPPWLDLGFDYFCKVLGSMSSMSGVHIRLLPESMIPVFTFALESMFSIFFPINHLINICH